VNVWLLIKSIKSRLITKLIAQIKINLWDEFIKIN
jgi:hypothetical protein